MLAEPENKYFDRKSAHIKTSDLAPWVAGFANAEGGTIVIGISDKTQKLEGINSVGADKINDFLNKWNRMRKISIPRIIAQRKCNRRYMIYTTLQSSTHRT